MERFGFDESNETVSCHKQVDGVLCFGESVFVRVLEVRLDFLSGLVVKVNLCMMVERRVKSQSNSACTH